MHRPYRYLGRGNGKKKKPPMVVKANPILYDHITPNHPDNVWIKSKNKKGGIGYFLSTHNKPSHIFHIYNRNNLITLWYNFLLWLRFLKRKGDKIITK